MSRPTEKWERREKKIEKRRRGMVVDGKSVKLLEELSDKRTLDILKKKDDRFEGKSIGKEE